MFRMNGNGVKRLREIVKIFVSYGFGYLVDAKLKNNQEKSPENLRKALIELGPTFIKFGQILSTRPDFIPANYIKELEKLQDSVSSEDISIIDKIFYKEFKCSIKETFIDFEERPIASASIAQVHRATLNGGRKVVVKIQHQDIYEKMNLDIKILMRLAKIANSKFEDSVINPMEVLQEIKDATEKELNFYNEAENIKKFRRLNKGVVCIYAPEVIEEFSGKKVITMEAIEGFKITDIEKLLLQGYDRNDVAKKLSLSFFKQAFDDGFFHGDPHPGNLLINDGRICFIDFGIIGELSPSIKKWINEAIIAIATKDIERIISFIMAVGVKTGKVNSNYLYEDLEYLFDNYLVTSLKNIKISVLLQEIFQIANRNNVQLPRDLVSLIRAMVILEGVVAQLAPEIDILDVVIPFVRLKGKKIIKENFDKDQLAFKLYNFTSDGMKLPSKLIELINSIVRGRTKIQFQVENLNSSIFQLNRMVNRMVFGFIVAAMIISSALIVNSNVGPKVVGISIIGITGYLISAVFALWLMISIIKSGYM